MLRFTLPALLLCLTLAPAVRAENPEHLRQLLASKNCARCDLTNAGLVMGDFSGADLRGANLAGANLSQAKLVGANLQGANLVGASLYGADLTGADLSGARLQATDLRESFLVGATFSPAALQGAYLQGAVGLSTNAGSAADFTNWGYQEWHKNNFLGAAQYFTQAIDKDPQLHHAYLGRAMARYRLQDDAGAIADAAKAEQLFTAAGDLKGVQSAQNIRKGIELVNQPSKPSQGGGGSFVDVLTGLSTVLLRMF